MIYQHLSEEKLDYNKLSDEELEVEKQRLLKELKESSNDCRESKSKG